MVQNEHFSRSALNRALLNRAILTNKYWYLSVDNEGHEDFQPVGRGARSSDYCARWVSLSVCKNVEGHKSVLVSGVDCTGKVVVRHKHWWCHKPTCPVCFNRGWSPREARSIVGRLDVGVKRGFGKVEHISVSAPPEDYGLFEEVLRENCRLAQSVRGVVGGCMIFHGFRIDRERDVLVWAPHYHSLGFIKGSFDVCRSCVHDLTDCRDCSGFKGREIREYEKDGYLVKVLGERKTVFGTSWYQLNHATVRVSLKRFHVVTWFGICGNRKFKSAKLESEDVCPACNEEMTRCFCSGKRRIVKDIGDARYQAWFVDDEFDEQGDPNYVEIIGDRGYRKR